MHALDSSSRYVPVTWRPPYEADCVSGAYTIRYRRMPVSPAVTVVVGWMRIALLAALAVAGVRGAATDGFAQLAAAGLSGCSLPTLDASEAG